MIIYKILHIPTGLYFEILNEDYYYNDICGHIDVPSYLDETCSNINCQNCVLDTRYIEKHKEEYIIEKIKNV